MVDVQDLPPPSRPGTTPTEPSRSPFRRIGWCISRTVLTFGFGGAVCGALAVNVASLVYFPLTMPCGFVLGAVVCVPITVPAGWWLSRQSPRDPHRLVRTLQIALGTLALAVNGTTNIWFAVETAPDPSESSIYALAAVGWLALAGVFTVASGFVGWTCGATLAHRFLVEIDHPSVPARHQARRRRPWR